MKKILMFVSLIVIANTGFGQSGKGPQVFLGKIRGAELVDGKWTNPVITRADILANTTLIAEGSTCKVTGYSFSVLPTGHDFMGPYTVSNSAELTPQIKKLVEDLGEGGGRVFIENIRVNCSGVDRKVASIVFKYK